MSTSQKPRLLVIGGGCAGVVMATKCSVFADVTLVDPKDYFEITWATVRGIVDANVASQSCIGYKEIPGIGRVIQASVTCLTEKEATLSTGEVVPFDYATICTGSSYSEAFKSASAFTKEQRLAELKSIAESIRTAKSIAVVGGGPAGVEAAAEIAEAFAGKNITLLHPGSHLLSALPAKAGVLAAKWMESRSVKVRLGVSVQDKPSGPGPATLALTDGTALAADLVLWCAGAKPNTAFLAAELAASVRDERNLIKVLPTLQVVGQPHMFALGDCTNVLENKMGFLAMKHAELAAASVKALIGAAGGKAPKLGVWTPNMGTEMMILSLGKYDGVCRVGGSVCGGCLPANIKSKTLFVGKVRGQLKVR